MRILLCEDDHNIATIARLALEQIGRHEIVHVADGEEAFRRGSTESYDLILLDDMMPKMSGVDVCAAYTKLGKKVPPVIFMSANPQHKRVEEFKTVAIGYIAKPFDPMTLNQQISDLLQGEQKKAV